MVRPLPVVNSFESLREFILSRPADSQGFHRAYCVLGSYSVETSEGEVFPLVIITIRDFAVSMYIQYCDIVEPNGHIIDATGVTSSVLCGDIPCAAGTSNLEQDIDFLREVPEGLASDGYEVEEILPEERGYATGARVDVLIDI